MARDRQRGKSKKERLLLGSGRPLVPHTRLAGVCPGEDAAPASPPALPFPISCYYTCDSCSANRQVRKVEGVEVG